MASPATKPSWARDFAKAEPTLPTTTPKPTPVPPIFARSGLGAKVLKFSAQDGPLEARIKIRGAVNVAVISFAGSDYHDLLVT